MPFAVAFDRSGHAVVAEAGPSAVATFTLGSGGVLSQLAVSDTGQAATCWIVRDGRYFYTSNAGSGSVSGYSVGSSGGLTALGNTTTDAGTVDAAAAGDGRFLYVQTGKAGIVDEFAVGVRRLADPGRLGHGGGRGRRRGHHGRLTASRAEIPPRAKAPQARGWPRAGGRRGEHRRGWPQ